ncbi:glycosyltransferase family 9 protein [Paludisphaera mucosa]|uniref:Glycosyltransferase family 9 protein n=1 Tax=Paludisphaera mucosa TaxID=3030827 RepID=A0ABT6F8Z4_9BACT|nr:glycosyltransferase family 9 protein [Paludisphaera mucosa]MDG3004059.1 glycosyltransferase family 9 protein [Paludisphaera mucosa]
MIRSPTDLKPVRTGRYRYSKLRWRILVRAFDAAGGLVAPIWRRLRPPREVDAPRRILVVQLDHLGDAVLTAPLIGQLRNAYPQAEIDVLASPSNHEVFEADANVTRVRIAERTWFERSPSRRGLAAEVWRLGASLRDDRYDLGIDVRGDVLSILVLAIGGVARRVGFAMGGGSFLLTDVAEWAPGRHEVRSRLALLEPLGVAPDFGGRALVHVRDDDRAEVAARLLDAWPRRAGRRRGRVARTAPGRESDASLQAEQFRPHPPMLAVHLGAGTAAKRWPKRHWKALIERFLGDGWRVVIVGGPEDPPLSRILTPDDRLVDWSGRLTVPQTTALLERADLFIGADSGPAHLAASAGATSVILFSGTNNPVQWRPWSSRSLVLRNRVACRPCHQKTCPLADHPCMTGLEPDRVYRAARRWLARTNRTEPAREASPSRDLEIAYEHDYNPAT